MKNFFEWEYNCGSLLQKDEKCLPNTDHTTGNAYQHIIDDSFNQADCRLTLHEKDERMIHCEDEDRFHNSHDDDVQDLDYLEEDNYDEVKIQKALPITQENFKFAEKAENFVTDQKSDIVTVQCQTQSKKNVQNQEQASADYKLSKKWKQKLNYVLEQKKIHEFSAKHNRNMAKFFVRLFSKYLKVWPEQQKISGDVQQKLQQILEKSSVSLDDLENLLGCENSGPCREFMWKILRTRLKQEVIKSQDVQNKAAYLLCCKVFALRCRSRHLIGRLQSR